MKLILFLFLSFSFIGSAQYGILNYYSGDEYDLHDYESYKDTTLISKD
jgi:hypothetical protein